jgi:hypothetical protein
MHSLVNAAIFPLYQFLHFSCVIIASDDLVACLPFNAARFPDRGSSWFAGTDWSGISLKPIDNPPGLAILRLGKSQVSGQEIGQDPVALFTTVD